MKKSTKLTCIILSVVMIFSCFTSCGSTEDETTLDSSTTTSTSVSTSTSTESSTQESDSLEACDSWILIKEIDVDEFSLEEYLQQLKDNGFDIVDVPHENPYINHIVSLEAGNYKSLTLCISSHSDLDTARYEFVNWLFNIPEGKAYTALLRINNVVIWANINSQKFAAIEILFEALNMDTHNDTLVLYPINSVNLVESKAEYDLDTIRENLKALEYTEYCTADNYFKYISENGRQVIAVYETELEYVIERFGSVFGFVSEIAPYAEKCIYSIKGDKIVFFYTVGVDAQQLWDDAIE